MKVYQHYKGDVYAVISDTALDQDDKLMVVYKNVHGDVFVQPFVRFYEELEIDGEIVPRFKLVYDDKTQKFFSPD